MLTIALQKTQPLLSASNSPQEVGLFGLTEAADSHMRQQLLLQNIFGILDPVFPSHSWLGSTNTNEVESNILLLNHKRFIQ